MAGNYISKTAFLKFEQCRKAFFFYKNHYYLRDKPSVDKQLTFKRGHDIGALAQQLFLGGINVVETDQNKGRAIEYTKELIEKRTPVIYEATLVYNGVMVMVDVLVLTEEGYFAYEVKSSVKISEIYIKDACLQYYVVKNILPELKDFFIVTINDAYLYNGTLNVKSLFKKRSIIKDALRNYGYIQTRLAEANEVIEQNVIPNVDIGKHCFSPYECDFFGTCWKDKITEESVFTLGKINKDTIFNWYNSGVKTISDIPITNDLSKSLKIQIESTKQKQAYFDKPGIKKILARIKKPYAAMDMEIWGQPVPEIIGTKPFQKIPFLYTLVSEEGEHAFFFDHEPDDRRAFAESLIEQTKNFESLLVYDKSLENMVIKELAELYSDLNETLKTVGSKMIDISDIIHEQLYFHYQFKGNYSLKAVSLAILNEDPFKDEQITSGLEAMNAFVSFRLHDNIIEKQQIKEDLIDYCLADSRATFLITEKFKELTE
ncbi:MAG: DUF2779 domain-containing protein [Bacteroidota bacterium]|nr:DUF2779 domain-containing protein [Bacteroidota bacterium]